MNLRKKICTRLLVLLTAVITAGFAATAAFAARITDLEAGSSTGGNIKDVTGAGNLFLSTVYFMPNAAKDATVTLGLKFKLAGSADDKDSIRILSGMSNNVTDLKFSDPGTRVGLGGNAALDVTGRILELKSGNTGADNVKVTFKVTSNDLASGSNKAAIVFQYYDASGGSDISKQIQLQLSVKPVPFPSISPAVYTADRSEFNGTPVSLTVGGVDAAAKPMLLTSGSVGWYKGPYDGSAVKIDSANNAITRPAAAAVSSIVPGDTGLVYGSDVLDNPRLIFSPAGKGPWGDYEYRLGVKSGDKFTYDGAVPVGYVEAEGCTLAAAKVVITDIAAEAKFTAVAAGAPGVGEFYNGEVVTHGVNTIETPVYYVADAEKPGRGTRIAFKVSGWSHSAAEITPSVADAGWSVTTVDGKNGKIEPDAIAFDYEDTIILTRTARGDLPKTVSINLSNTGAGGFLNETRTVNLDPVGLSIKGKSVSFEKGTAAAKASHFVADAGKWGVKYVAVRDVNALYIDGDSRGSNYIAPSAADPAVSAHAFWGDVKAAKLARDVDNTTGAEVTGITLATTAETDLNANSFKVYLTRSAGSPFMVLEGGPASDAAAYAYWGSSLLSANIPFEAEVVESGSGDSDDNDGGDSGDSSNGDEDAAGDGSDNGDGDEDDSDSGDDNGDGDSNGDGSGNDNGNDSGVGSGEIPVGSAQPVANMPAGEKIKVGINVVIPGKKIVSVSADKKNAVIKELASQGVTVSARDNYIVVEGKPMPNINKTYNIPVIATLSDGT